MTQRKRPAKTITFAPELLAQVEGEASRENVTVSELIESHLREHYEGSAVRLEVERLAHQFHAFQSMIMPVVAKVAALIQQFEQEGTTTPHAKELIPVAPFPETYGDFDRRVP